MPSLVVASYNVHGGVDGWGRPFDVVDACRRVGADVLVLQESWSGEGKPSVAAEVGAALGYDVTEMTLASGRIAVPAEDPWERWGPRLFARSGYGLRLAHPRRLGDSRPPPPRRASIERGTWGLAVLSRLPVVDSFAVELPQLRSDPARRGAIAVDVALSGDGPRVWVVGTHLAHLTQGSPRHIAILRRRLADAGLGGASRRGQSPPAALAGDMNLWGPPLSLLLPGWRRAVRGRTWPTWSGRPVAQSDHVLVTPSVGATGTVVHVGGSDHLPVRAELVIL